MKRKTRQLILILVLFTMPILLQSINTRAIITSEVAVGYPTNNKIFPFRTQNKTFKGNSTTQGLALKVRQCFEYKWYIDDELIDSGCGSEKTDSDGILTVKDYDTEVDISTYDVGEHNVTLSVGVEGVWKNSTSIIWSRGEESWVHSHITATIMLLGVFVLVIIGILFLLRQRNKKAEKE